MIKYFFLYMLVSACSAISFAQQVAIKTVTPKAPLLQIPMVHFTPVSDRFVPVHINMVKPVVVSLDHAELANRREAVCKYFKSLTPALVLRANRENNITTQLEWETRYAFYAKGFDIERSLLDSFHFQKVNDAAVSGKTDFHISYQLPDANDFTGLSYYRIRQSNGRRGFTYSNIVAVEGRQPAAVKTKPAPFRLYPVPATNTLWIDFVPTEGGDASIMVYDIAGRCILRQTTTCTKTHSAVQTIDINRLAPGVYQLKLLLSGKPASVGTFIRQ